MTRDWWVTAMLLVVLSTSVGVVAADALTPDECEQVIRMIQIDTAQLNALNDRYVRSTEPFGLLHEMRRIADTRQDFMRTLGRTDPRAMVSLALSSDEREAFPASVRAMLEEPVVMEGALGVSVEDDFQHGTSRMRYGLTVNGSRYVLHLPEVERELVSGSTVRIEGVRVGADVYVVHEPGLMLGAAHE